MWSRYVSLDSYSGKAMQGRADPISFDSSAASSAAFRWIACVNLWQCALRNDC